MIDRIPVATWWLLVLLLVGGCRLPTGSPRDEILLDVPFRPQEEHQCGAAALGMVLAFWGRPVAAEVLERELFIPALRGTIPALVLDAARRHGLDADSRAATLPLLGNALRASQPPIVFLGPARREDTGHFAVVTGMRDHGREIRLHAPAQPDQWWPGRTFRNRWETGGNLAMFCTHSRPPGP